jgi:Ca2+-binding RTX toxin-like protein
MPIAMHGRTIALAGALLSLTLAGTARADQTLGLGDPSATDAVVTSWQLTSGLAQSGVKLRSLQALGGGGTAPTATSDPVTAAPSQPIAARLPIAVGGTLTLVGATGSPTVAATAEPDADGDGYGDTTQDACPSDFTAHAAPCPGGTTAGAPLTLAPDPRGFGDGNPIQALRYFDPSFSASPLPYPSVVTRWRFRAQPGSGDTVLQVVRRDSQYGMTVVAETAPQHVTDDGVVSLPAQIPVDGAFTVAARSVHAGSSSDLGAVAYAPGEDLYTQQPPATAGGSFTVGPTYAGRRLLVQADVEPDKDRDGKGDISQETPATPPAAPPVIYDNPPPAGTQQPFVVIACANVVKGTRDDDVLRGTVFGDRLVGGDGADLLRGDAGNDCLEGGSGNDVLDGGNGDDRLAGDAGNDRLTGGKGADSLKGGRGDDRLSGGSGNDIISPGAGKDTISGGPGSDTINSVDGVRETVDCGSGRDTVRADRRDHLVRCERITRKR